MTTIQHRPAAAPATERDHPAVEAAHPAHPADLIARHPELYGIHGFADVLADSVLWSA